MAQGVCVAFGLVTQTFHTLQHLATLLRFCHRQQCPGCLLQTFRNSLLPHLQGARNSVRCNQSSQQLIFLRLR